MICPTDTIDLIERIIKSYRYDQDVLENDPDPVCAIMDMHDIMAHTDSPHELYHKQAKINSGA
jgi:hypothetical protein